MKKVTFPEGGVLYENDYTVKKIIAPGNILEAKEVKIEDLDDPASIQQEPSNLAEIDYVIEGKNIRIIELRNFKSLDEIFEKYGKAIGNAYFGGKVYMEKQIEPNTIRIFDDGIISNLQEGQKISKVKFECLIPVMKKAGNRLHNLIKQSKNKGLRTVKI